MVDKFKHIRKIHFAEIPSIKIENDNLFLANGLHIILTNNKKEEHKVYLPSNFTTNIIKYKLYNNGQFTKRDKLAFHIYRFLMTTSFTDCQIKVLYILLRYSNNVFKTIEKLVLFLISYYCL